MKWNYSKAQYVFIIVTFIFIAVILLIPLGVISQGYMPPDDALRHAAKAVSGKSWDEILVLRPEIKMDSHVGWHNILEFIFKTMGCSIDCLVVFSICSLFFLYCLVPIFFLKRPEAWLIALLIIVVANAPLLLRILLGRPFIFTMATIVALCFIWPHFREKKISWMPIIILTILIALATWVHCLWYMFALPILCFFLAREWKAGVIVSLCSIAGIIIGMLMTGHPIIFFQQTLSHLFSSFGGHPLSVMLVSEFRPFNGDNMMVLVVCVILLWRVVRNSWNIKVIDNPVFILAAVSWVLGFFVARVWNDWGLPAICVWIVLEIQCFLESKTDNSSLSRVGLTLVVAVVLFISITNDYGSRWTRNLSDVYLSIDNTDKGNWLPEEGGIIYSNDMSIFFQTFYANPHARWRYMLGFEPSLMPAEDLAIYRNIKWNEGNAKSFEPWIRKMKKADRLILKGQSLPVIKELEWYYTAKDTWIGRLPADRMQRK